MGVAMNDLADSASEQWQELWSLMAQLQAAEPTELVKFHGGNQREDGIFETPWASYDATVNRIVELLYDLKVVQDVDWSGWQSAINSDLLYDAERIKWDGLNKSSSFAGTDMPAGQRIQGALH